METRTGLTTALSLALLLAACGGDSETKQAALSPVEQALADDEPAGADSTRAKRPPAALDSARLAAVDAAVADSGEQDKSLTRESFSYSGGSRDPFGSLLASSKVGPELPDLTLVAIYYDTRNPASSVVVLREKVNEKKKYNLRPGDRLGRIRLTEVRPKEAVFTIDDFGTERRESLSLRKQEDTQ